MINDPAGTFVYIAEPAATQGQATVQRRAVEVGELSQYGIEIVDGLRLGALVITAGLSVIREGQSVLISLEQSMSD